MLSKVRELEAMAAKLSVTARNIPQEKDREEAFREIAKFRDKIAALKKTSDRSARLNGQLRARASTLKIPR